MDIRPLVAPASILLLALLTFSCASTTTLHKGFTKNKSSLSYIYDSDMEDDTTGHRITIHKAIVTDPQFTMPGMVRKVRASAIPLIVYTQWNAEYAYNIGSSAIKEDIASFVQSALIEESARSGTFVADATPSNRLTLEIEIDSLGAKGPYHSDGYFMFLLFFYSWYAAEKAGEGHAYSRFHYRLKDGEKVLMEDVVSSQSPTKPLIPTLSSGKALRSFYNANLVEALSLTFKTNIEIIVEDIDIFLHTESSKISQAD